MNRGIWITVGATVGLGGALFFARRASAAVEGPKQAPSPATLRAPLPRPHEVRGDLVRNWGSTPEDLRPLFLRMEETSQIAGSARVFAVIAYGESRFIPEAHNGNDHDEERERAASRRAYENNKDRNPPLRYGEAAADFGSGGLFGALAPYFLWSGVAELGASAPLLAAPPELVYFPRAAAFGATVHLQRLLRAHYKIGDVLDVKAGWANPSLLTTARGGKTYLAARGRFQADADTLGVDFADRDTIPTLSNKAWPGVPAAFAGLVGSLPREWQT